MLMFKEKKCSMEKATVDLFEKGEELIDLFMKASGITFTDMLKGMDAKTGAFMGGCMELYTELKDLYVNQAEAFDDLLNDMEELRKMNERLLKQNEDLQKLLQEKE